MPELGSPTLITYQELLSSVLYFSIETSYGDTAFPRDGGQWEGARGGIWGGWVG